MIEKGQTITQRVSGPKLRMFGVLSSCRLNGPEDDDDENH